jgi:sec-independent protein translocase protein TatC
VSLSIGRLRVWGSQKPEPDPEGRMTLVEHLRELRSRLIKSVVALLVCMSIAWYFRDALFNLLTDPLIEATNQIAKEKRVEPLINFPNPASPLMMMLKISLVGGVVASCPVWLYQIWSLIVPGLHRHERKWTMVFLGTAAPLFIAGILLGYWVMPKGFAVLLGFTPQGELFQNILNMEEFLDFVLRLLLVFGIAFLIPVFVVLLNLVGVLTTERIKKWRAPIIFVIFVFAAVATPTIDPITMLLLALPMTALFLIAEVIARAFDRQRRRRLIAQGIDVDSIERAGRLDDD